MSFPRKINQFITWVRPWFAANIAASLMAGGMIITQAYLLSQVINRVHLQNATLQQLMPLLWILLGIILCRAILAGISDIFASRTAAGIKERLRELLMQAVVRQSFVRRSKEETGELATVVVEGVEALDAYFSQYLPQLVIAVLLPVTILFVIFPIDFLSGIIFLVTAPLIPVFMILIGKTGEILTKRQWNQLSRLSTHFLDTIQGLEELKGSTRVWKKPKKFGKRVMPMPELLSLFCGLPSFPPWYWKWWEPSVLHWLQCKLGCDC